ncbi:nitroreductase family protein [Parahaliea mediterranea]|uniref:Nitroreductase family protein n=1 Tax=Parahaliea mediterranea TaxID=651086 RepID=A0A939DHX1_9GAMM|nr:nitroreductase family protein [Parahaliea mediterranea]MBN7798328.1 nitroreductase family protein [Parahaliea mediterranea]
MQLLPAMQWRYAVRQFNDERLAEQDVYDLIDATRLSASAFGLQPYRLIRVDSRQTRERLLPHAMGQDKVVHCSHLLVLAAETAPGAASVERYMRQLKAVRALAPQARAGMAEHVNGVLAEMSLAQRLAWAREQAFIALGTLLAAAAVMGIDSCPMTGFDSAGFDAVLKLPDQGLTAVALCALGRRHPRDATAEMGKVRTSYADFLKVV